MLSWRPKWHLHAADSNQRRHPETTRRRGKPGLGTRLQRLGHDQLDVAAAAETLGAVLKYREDAERVRRALEVSLLGNQR